MVVFVMNGATFYKVQTVCSVIFQVHIEIQANLHYGNRQPREPVSCNCVVRGCLAWPVSWWQQRQQCNSDVSKLNTYTY